MPANEGGYELNEDDMLNTLLSGGPFAGRAVKMSRPKSFEEEKLDTLIAEVQAMHATVNQMSALLWQLMLQAQGVDVTLLPNDQTDTSGIISANGLSIKE